MEDFGDLLTPTGLGIASLVTMFVILIYRGILVPRSTVQLLTDSYDHRLADKDREIETWQRAFQQSETARSEQANQMNELLDNARASAHVLESLPKPKELEGGR